MITCVSIMRSQYGSSKLYHDVSRWRTEVLVREGAGSLLIGIGGKSLWMSTTVKFDVDCTLDANGVRKVTWCPALCSVSRIALL